MAEERTCATHEHHVLLLQSNPEYARRRAAIEASTTRFIQAARSATVKTVSEVKIIPVVVHVLYTNDGNNVSDEQVHSQIEALNRDFQKLNKDVDTAPDAYRKLASDLAVEFELTTRHPEGYPTKGINRIWVKAPDFEYYVVESDDMKFTSTGGWNAWDTTRYLNIWVVPDMRSTKNKKKTISGFGTFPGAPPAIDGVVITHKYFGTTGSAAAPFNLGRTGTHEVGHWFNLFHIWGDELHCKGDDEVADTPKQEGPNYGTPKYPHITCKNGPDGDMFMNYMDYVDDKVMVMFTEGQVERMQAALAGPRAELGVFTAAAASA